MSDATIRFAEWRVGPPNGPFQGMRAVIFWDECAYIAFCVDWDVCAQGRTPDEALSRLKVAAFLEEATRLQMRLPPLPKPPADIRRKWTLASVSVGESGAIFWMGEDALVWGEEPAR